MYRSHIDTSFVQLGIRRMIIGLPVRRDIGPRTFNGATVKLLSRATTLDWRIKGVKSIVTHTTLSRYKGTVVSAALTGAIGQCLLLATRNADRDTLQTKCSGDPRPTQVVIESGNSTVRQVPVARAVQLTYSAPDPWSKGMSRHKHHRRIPAGKAGER